ncbi:MAG TPA: GNAT family N-acetyltransferase [Abditibacteriaceae bacterium]|jgi:GNAT superfamily N-acetyltransferase
MLKVIRTNSADNDFQDLVRLLDEELRQRDGEENVFYAQFNKTDAIKNVVVTYENEKAVGCGAFKEFDANGVEIKRMFVRPENRGKGVAGEILKALEKWARELNFQFAVLETGKRQPEAIKLYQKSGYELIPNYGQYEGVENSVCMRKALKLAER